MATEVPYLPKHMSSTVLCPFFQLPSAHFYYVCLHVTWGLLNAEALSVKNTVFSIPPGH